MVTSERWLQSSSIAKLKFSVFLSFLSSPPPPMFISTFVHNICGVSCVPLCFIQRTLCGGKFTVSYRTLCKSKFTRSCGTLGHHELVGHHEFTSAQCPAGHLDTVNQQDTMNLPPHSALELKQSRDLRNSNTNRG